MYKKFHVCLSTVGYQVFEATNCIYIYSLCFCINSGFTLSHTRHSAKAYSLKQFSIADVSYQLITPSVVVYQSAALKDISKRF